jgi:release factor glutamine methyltransferase
MNTQFIIRNSQSSIQGFLRSLCNRLSPLSDTPALDAQVLLAYVTGKPRSWILTHPEASLVSDQQKALDIALKRLENGQPLPHILGHREFYELDFEITPDTLIPRPETELLVDHALCWLREHPSQRVVADIGTGSGNIAISLAVNIPDLQVVATDISTAALAIARGNAQKHNVADQIEFIQADLLNVDSFTPFSKLSAGCSMFNVICANLPYIPTGTLKGLEIYKREPTLALDGGPDGLVLIRRLLSQAAQILAPGGLLLFEIEATQGQKTLKLACDHFTTSEIFLLPDLAGHDRLLRIRTTVE